jgi:hypothetical protein
MVVKMNLSSIKSLTDFSSTLDACEYATNYPRLTYFPLAFGIAAITTILAVKICDSYNPDALSDLKFKTINFHKEYPAVPVIVTIIFLAAGIFSLSLGIIAAVPLGIYSGWRFDLDRTTRLQKLHADGNHLQNPYNQLAQS